MKFTKPEDVLKACQDMKEAAGPRGRNRARIDALFNGDAPYTQEECDEHRIVTNVNFLEAATYAHGARSIFDQAFSSSPEQFMVRLDVGPDHKREQWGQQITRLITRMLKRSPQYRERQKQKFAQLVLHGSAISPWRGPHDIIPDFIPISDTFFPSRSLRDMSNVTHFAFRREYTAADLMRMVSGTYSVKGWDKELVRKAVAKNKDANSGTKESISQWNFEKMVADYKENPGGYAQDTAPLIGVWDFYFYEEAKKGSGWRRRMMLDSDSGNEQAVDDSKFLFNPDDREYGKGIYDLFATQFADGNSVTPFRYGSIRSLGYFLYGTAHLANRLRCQTFDAAFRECMMLFRNVGDGDRERLELVELTNMACIPEGLNLVPSNERHQINEQLVFSTLQATERLMAQQAAQYRTGGGDPTTSTPQKTATQVMAEQTTANALVGSMLNDAYAYEEAQDLAICRRLCDPKNKNPDGVRFREILQQMGLPPLAMNPDTWEVTRIRQIGSGNRALRLAMADRLMAIRPYVDPQAQRIIDRVYISVTVDDPGLVDSLVPMDEKEPSDTVSKATMAWGTMYDGKTVVLGRNVNRVEVIETWLQMLNQELQQIQQAQQEGGEQPTSRTVMGLANVVQHISQQLALFSQAETEKERIKAYSDALSQAANQVEAIAEQVAEQNAEHGGLSPEAQAKIQAMLITAESKAKISEDKAAQSRLHKDMAFRMDQQRKTAQTRAEIAAADARTAAEIRRENLKAALEPKEAAAPKKPKSKKK